MQLCYGFRVALGVALSGVLVCPVALGRQADDIAAARELYVAAAYQDGLAMLDRLASSASASRRDRALIDHYRALCLLALSRPQAAAAAVESMVRHDPLYTPGETELSPRTRQLFHDVRRRVLPTVVQDQYAQAKSAYEAGRASEAAAAFEQVVQVIDAVDALGNAPPLMADMRVLATGFRDLASASAARTATEPAAPTEPPHPAAEPPGAGPATQAEAPARPVEVSPPVTVRQQIPPWPGDVPLPEPAVAVVEVVIGADGRVQAARVVKPLHPRYDLLLLAAARDWVYRPALRDGRPTPFVKAVRVELSAPGR